jgi:riboflavin kinase/FMN adenylyltransferase
LEIQGEKVSSRSIKKHLTEGEVAQANVLLGERFFLLGEVIKDRGVGRTIGFPTANILYPQDKFPLKQGVYESRVTVDGISYKGITNYGARPTFDNERVITETYLDGFDGDLYGKTLKVEFVRYLRDITRFDSVETLKRQLTKDIERVRNYD